MRRAARHHAARALVLAAVVALLAAGGWEYHARSSAHALRDQLLRAATADVPAIVDDMAPYRRRVDPLLREAYAEAEAGNDARRQLHLSLALLPSDRGQVGYLCERLLDARPEEFAVIRDRLSPHTEELVERLWAELGDRARDLDRRFRAACALAAYAPDDPRWDRFADAVAAKLVAENALVVGHWVRALEPVGERLLPPLAAVLEDEKRGAAARRTSSELYLAFAAGRPAAFSRLEAIARGDGAASPAPSPGRARRRANVAAALIAMGRAEKVWDLLAHRPDPTARSYLIEQIASAGGSPGVLELQLTALDGRANGEPGVSTRRALILALGSFAPERLPTAAPHLLRLYETDPDPGVHGAAEWVLRKWGQDHALRTAAARLATGRVEGAREWYVNAEGQTFSCARPHRLEVADGDRRRTVEVDYRFAIATKEVTVGEYQRFRRQDYSQTVARDSDCPMNSVAWSEAAAYCNYLSKRDEIPEAQWCYVPPPEGGAGLVAAPDVAQRTGYRLPTEAEWELAARAGATTRYAFGDVDDDLLGSYAWYERNSYAGGQQSWPVGRLKPNDLRLFDTHGNVLEWCHEVRPGVERADVPPDPTGGATGAGLGVLRGGSLYGRALDVGADARIPTSLVVRGKSNGFRPARRLP